MQRVVVLARQPLREHEWLLDVFSEHRGRHSLVCGRQAPDLLSCWQADWQPAQDWPKIKGLQPLQHFELSGQALYCALYMVELLHRLLPRNDPHPSLFRTLLHCLKGLEQGLPDPWLRLFEMQLLHALGYGFSWLHDSAGQAIDAQKYYRFEPDHGFAVTTQGLQGQWILAFAQGHNQPMAWKAAKQVLRQALERLLTHPLISRELFLERDALVTTRELR